MTFTTYGCRNCFKLGSNPLLEVKYKQDWLCYGCYLEVTNNNTTI